MPVSNCAWHTHFCKTSDSDKCGSLTHCTSNDDQCPKKAMDVSDAFQSHMWDQTHTEAKKKNANKKKNQNQIKAMTKTRKVGHHWQSMSLAQQHNNTVCHCCGEKGHCASEHPMKNKMS